MKDVCIIGGGISGLSAAWHLQKFAPKASYSLVESTTKLGGKIQSKHRNGFLIEGGPDSLLVQKTAALDLCLELGLGSHLIPMNKHRIYILHNRKLVPIPAGFKLIAPTDKDAFLNSSLFSSEGKKRILQEMKIPPNTTPTDESLADFVRRRFGEECLQRIASPLLAGIYVADPEKLSIQSAFPHLVALEKKYGSVIKGTLAEEQRKPFPLSFHEKGLSPAESNAISISGLGRPQLGPFISLKNGLGELINTLKSKLAGQIYTGAKVQKILKIKAGYEIFLPDRSIRCKSVICTIPASLASSIVEQLNPVLATVLQEIKFVSSATLSLGFRKSDFEIETNFDGFGFLISPTDKHRILSASISSKKFNLRAPKDRTLIRVFFGGHGNEKIVTESDTSLVETACAELKEIIGLRSQPTFHRIFRWIKANPQYNLGHLDRVSRIEALASKSPALYFTGTSYRGVGISDCISNARLTVEKLLS